VTTTITIPNSYPIFTPNQVLTNKDLNRVVTYLDEQNRLTRVYLIGMGIVAGMEVSSIYQPGDVNIVVAPGCGITSEGYIISLAETKLTHYQSGVSVPSALFAPSEEQTAASTDQLVELFEQEGNNRLALKNLPDENAFARFLADQTLVVVYELQDQQRDSCLLDCDDTGKDRNFRLRYFLLPRSVPEKLSAEALLQQGFSREPLPQQWRDFSINDIFQAQSSFFQNFFPQVRRFGYTLETPPVIRLSNIVDYDAFLKGYQQVCLQAIDEIDRTFPNLFRLFSPFFSSFNPAPSDFTGLKTLLNQRLSDIVSGSSAENRRSPISQIEAQYALQYFYDYLSQLVSAFRELAESAFDLMDDATPDTRRFPKFLMLGLVPLPNQKPEVYALNSPYRSNFSQSPIYNGNQLRVKQVRFLYDRLVRLCAADSFYLLPFYDTPLKITPSKDRAATLSQQAIPYYLNYPQLYQYWSYDTYRKGRSQSHPAYFYPNNANITPNSDLLHRLDDYSFYRIEGHIGEANATALQRILDYQQRYNLAFDVITLKIGNLQSFQDINISGQFDDLNADFGRIKDTFAKLWQRYEESWSRNVFLYTLKRVFFDKTSLAEIKSDQLFNPIVARASVKEAYEFVKESGDSYRLYLRNAAGIRIARFETVINFSGLSGDSLTQEQERIIGDLLACLPLGKITYGVEPESANNPLSYYLRFSLADELDLPANRGTADISFISLNFFTVNFEGNSPIINQPEFQDFETLYSLLRDVPESSIRVNRLELRMGDRLAADTLNYFELKGLMTAYQQRLAQIMELQLFHKFAQNNPGMEHLGGVPKGGTFVLVYVDGRELVRNLLSADRDPTYQARTEVIKKYASLPPGSPQELATSRELLNREDIVVGDFCLPYRFSSKTPTVSYVLTQPRPIVLLDRTTFCAGDETRYEFILDPTGGTLKGEGSFFADGKYYFQPSRITDDITSETAITFTYVVESSYDTLSVTVYPLPDASFQIKTNFCSNENPVTLRATQPGGNFRAFDSETDISASVINNQEFNPSAVNLGGATEKVITLVYTITSDQGCTNELSRDITIFAVPNATFQVGQGKTRFCSNDEPVDLIARVPGGTFQVRDGAEDISADVINRLTTPPQFDPSAVNLGVAREKVITLEYSISNQGCSNKFTQELRIFAVPNANFRLSTGNRDTFTNNDPPVGLIATQLGGTFQAFDGEEDITADVISPTTPPQFNPSAVNLGDEEEKVITLRYTISNQGCSNNTERRVTIVPPPEVPVRDVEDTSNPDSGDAPTENPIPHPEVRAVNLLAISNNEVINSTNLDGDRTFNLSDFNPNNQYTFEAMTVPEKVNSVIFTYTKPNGSRQALTANTAPYRMPDDWQPSIGIHEIQAQAIREVNGDRLEGATIKVIIRVIDADTDTSPSRSTNPDNLFTRIQNLFPLNRGEIITKIKLPQLLAMSTAIFMLIVGWTYSSSKQVGSTPPSVIKPR